LRKVLLLLVALGVASCGEEALPNTADDAAVAIDHSILADLAGPPDFAVADLRMPDLAGVCPMSCGANQVCVIPGCYDLQGETCMNARDAGNPCPSGYVERYTNDCPTANHDLGQPDIVGCAARCPAPDPFCLDLPDGCFASPTCACFSVDPCETVNGGNCQDDHFTLQRLDCVVQQN
jgi:hypothetical protein